MIPPKIDPLSISGGPSGGWRKFLGRSVAKYQRFPVIEIGFSAPYAKPLHRKTAMKWRGLPRRGTAKKFVKGKWARVQRRGVYWGPAGINRWLAVTYQKMVESGRFRRIILKELKSGQNLRQACIAGAKVVMREAQLRTPQDTGRLVRSAFVRSGTTYYK